MLLLLTAGLVAGPGTDFSNRTRFSAGCFSPWGSPGVAIALFEGGLPPRLHEVREVAGVERNLVAIEPR